MRWGGGEKIKYYTSLNTILCTAGRHKVRTHTQERTWSSFTTANRNAGITLAYSPSPLKPSLPSLADFATFVPSAVENPLRTFTLSSPNKADNYKEGEVSARGTGGGRAWEGGRIPRKQRHFVQNIAEICGKRHRPEGFRRSGIIYKSTQQSSRKSVHRTGSNQQNRVKDISTKVTADDGYTGPGRVICETTFSRATKSFLP